MTTQSDPILKPPYVSYTTFINCLNKLRETSIPDRIDPTVFSGQSGSTIASMIQAIKYFGLVDGAGKPQEEFRALVIAEDSKRAPILKNLLLEKYPFVTSGDFSLANATSGQFEKAFRDQGISGSTITKSVSFFLAAAEAAGLAMSPHVKAPKPPRANVAGKVRRKNTAGSMSGSGKNAAQTTSTPPSGSTATLLLNKFPDFDPTWPDELKTKWFASFETLQKLMTDTAKIGGT